METIRNSGVGEPAKRREMRGGREEGLAYNGLRETLVKGEGEDQEDEENPKPKLTSKILLKSTSPSLNPSKNPLIFSYFKSPSYISASLLPLLKTTILGFVCSSSYGNPSALEMNPRLSRMVAKDMEGENWLARTTHKRGSLLRLLRRIARGFAWF